MPSATTIRPRSGSHRAKSSLIARTEPGCVREQTFSIGRYDTRCGARLVPGHPPAWSARVEPTDPHDWSARLQRFHEPHDLEPGSGETRTINFQKFRPSNRPISARGAAS